MPNKPSNECAQVSGSATDDWFADALPALLSRRELSANQVRCALTAMMEGRCVDTEASAFLIALRMKGETSSEIAAAASVLREHMLRWDAGPRPVLDTCGTGGDGSGTFNISTVTAFVAAAAGVPVVKHGNRSVSSRSGSADVLASLGIEPEGDAEKARRSLEKCGLAFCFAPNFHPALKHVAALRKRLGVSTLFNWLGPLANPAGAAFQLLGVGSPAKLDLIAGAVAKLGTRRTLVVCSQDGLDEVSLSARTMVRQIHGNEISTWEWEPADFGLQPCGLEELRADGPTASAAIIREVLEGKNGAPRRAVLANAAAAFIAAERVTTPREGVELAEDAIDSGKALRVLKLLSEGLGLEPGVVSQS